MRSVPPFHNHDNSDNSESRVRGLWLMVSQESILVSPRVWDLKVPPAILRIKKQTSEGLRALNTIRFLVLSLRFYSLGWVSPLQ